MSIKRALISVSDKTGIVEFAQFLTLHKVEIYSTGGTYSLLKSSHIPVKSVSDITSFPEIMNGRVKTMHPFIMGGILGRRDVDSSVADELGINWIDLVVCNLYPFEKTIQKEGVTLEEAIENIDIGGPTMIRSAAKNFNDVLVVTSVDQYSPIMDEFSINSLISYNTRREAASVAFSHTARYDALIQSYLEDSPFPKELSLGFSLFNSDNEDGSLRYGENPHQKAAVYRASLAPHKKDEMSLLDAPQLQGKHLSFNNLSDTQGAIETLREFNEPTCVVVKHGTPCGVSSNPSPLVALKQAYEADSLSAFGSIIAINALFDEEMASYISKLFIEVLVAPSFSPQALEILKKKKNLRVLQLSKITKPKEILSGRFIGSDLLLQTKDAKEITEKDVECVTKTKVSTKEMEELLFAWNVVKHVKSNAIVISYNHTTCGIGGGQVSRVDATDIALRKSGQKEALVLASDAFFPFKDSIEILEGKNIKAIIQPGGSIRDNEVIDACDTLGIAMVFTHTRSFLHA
ncbi:MAG: bifunctional phosphoribosylaminoimidazolecarboxamide formyltransferase/IMP cyclohydrolase [Spirochaetia bacterium]|nr:bifunctional phosphoribosylaminoimidazolecarboxamide formyltransferase/IMP cyclohydrolase [Spirochaetia bacterium]